MNIEASASSVCRGEKRKKGKREKKKENNDKINVIIYKKERGEKKGKEKERLSTFTSVRFALFSPLFPFLSLPLLSPPPPHTFGSGVFE